MESLLNRISVLMEEIKKFPLGDCSPSDDPDKQSAYVYAFLDISKRLLSSLKRLDNEQLQKELVSIDTDIQFITEAYDLRASIINIIDLFDDITQSQSSVLTSRPILSPQVVNKLLSEITAILVSESANILPIICSNYGLAEGDVSEAFKSKRNYVYARTAHLSPDEVLKIARRMVGKYQNSSLDTILTDLKDNQESLNVVSQFENIKKLLIQEIESAKFLIWIAVSWFTDRDLANKLYSKSQQGVNIQIIINRPLS